MNEYKKLYLKWLKKLKINTTKNMATNLVKKYMDWQEDSEDSEDWDDCFCWEEWEDEENPKISFVWYD